MMGKAMAEVIMNEQNRQAALVALLSYQRDLGVDLRLSSNGMNRFDEVASDAATRGQGAASSAVVATTQAVNVAKAPQAPGLMSTQSTVVAKAQTMAAAAQALPAWRAVQAFDGCPLKATLNALSLLTARQHQTSCSWVRHRAVRIGSSLFC